MSLMRKLDVHAMSTDKDGGLSQMTENGLAHGADAVVQDSSKYKEVAIHDSARFHDSVEECYDAARAISVNNRELRSALPSDLSSDIEGVCASVQHTVKTHKARRFH